MTLRISTVFDDRQPVVGSTPITFYGQQLYTNDVTPTVRVELDASPLVGETLRLTGGGNTFDHVLTLDDIRLGYVDTTLTLPEGWWGVQGSLIHADGSSTALANAVDFRIDTQAPAAPTIAGVTDDTGAQTGAVAPGGTTDDTTPTLSVAFDTEIPPPTGGSPGHNPHSPSTVVGGQMELFVDGAVVSSVYVSNTSPQSVTLPQLTAGTHTLTTRLVDLAGNGGAVSAPFTITIAADTQPAPTAASGQVYTSPGPGSTLVGGAGNDTLNGSQGSDVLTGGAGADTFAWAREPWSPATVTDFTVGSDRLDLSALFRTSGYTGTDPVGDHYVSFLAQGSDTLVLFDRDGAGTAQQWPNYIIKLQGVSSGDITWSQLSGSTATGGGGPSDPPPPSAAAGDGEVIVSTRYGDTLVGGAGADTLQAGQGPDQLTGREGADHFAFQALPWNAGHITDFTPGLDKIDLSALFDANPGGLVEARAAGADTQIYFDRDADGGDWPFLITTVDGVAPSQLGSGWLIV